MKTQVISAVTKIIVVVILTLSVGTIYGQEPERSRPPMIPDSTQIVKMVDELAKELQLSKVQKQKISNLYFAHFKEMKSKQEAKIRQQEKDREEMQLARQKFETQVNSQLTKDQQFKYAEFKKGRKKHQGNKPKAEINK